MLSHRLRISLLCLSILLPLVALPGCARKQTRVIEATAYCGCGECCGWTRGRWLYLKLNFWNRYLDYGTNKGDPYTGLTAAGVRPRTYNPGLISLDSLAHPWRIPVRIVLPWRILPHDGSIAADTDYYPFGTKMYVPGYGWGVVEDRGGAIKGPDRIDLYFRWHGQTLNWGRRRVEVTIVYPE